jgi:hypothetical protein
MNTFALSLPAAADGGRELYEPAVARRIIAAVVDSWEPDGARWTSVSLYRAQEPKPREHVIGWFTYLASRLSRPAELLERAGGQPFGHGYLFTLSERAEDVCVESALSLKHELTEVGVLARTP